jgi:hypothetical protein
MKLDTFTISRGIFLIFIVVISVYFIVENKKTKKTLEKFEDKAVAAAAQSSLSQQTPATTATSASGTTSSGNQTVSSAAQTAVSTPINNTSAPKGGSTAQLSTNKEPAKEPEEKIALEKPVYIDRTNDKEIETSITDAYQQLYGNNPSDEEMAFYKNFVKNRDITQEKLLEVIDASAPTLQKTFYKTKAQNDGIFGNESEIIEVFNEVLDRNPDRDELYNFAKMLKDDTSFNLDKLRQVLIASEEFKRLERTQTNRVYVNLQSNITDRQITMQVTKIYIDTTGKEYIDEDTLKFLKKKFVEFELSEAKLIRFINAYLNDKPYVETKVETVEKTVEKTTEKTSEKQTNASTLQDQLKQSVFKNNASTSSAAKNTVTTQITKKEGFLDTDGKNVFTDNVFNFFGTNGANEDVINALMSKGAYNTNGAIDTDSMITNIKDDATCVFSKNAAEDELLAKNKQELSNYINDRNMSHLKSVCQRNKRYGKYMNADDDMVLNPEFKWSVPQKYPPVCIGGNNSYSPLNDQTALLGTLLNDAENTKVGSILPVFPPV